MKDFFGFLSQISNNKQLRHSEFRVLTVMAAKANETGALWHSPTTLGELVGMQERNVRRALQRLQELKLIKRVPVLRGQRLPNGIIAAKDQQVCYVQWDVSQTTEQYPKSNLVNDDKPVKMTAPARVNQLPTMRKIPDYPGQNYPLTPVKMTANPGQNDPVIPVKMTGPYSLEKTLEKIKEKTIENARCANENLISSSFLNKHNTYCAPDCGYQHISNNEALKEIMKKTKALADSGAFDHLPPLKPPVFLPLYTPEELRTPVPMPKPQSLTPEKRETIQCDVKRFSEHCHNGDATKFFMRDVSKVLADAKAANIPLARNLNELFSCLQKGGRDIVTIANGLIVEIKDIAERDAKEWRQICK